MKRIIAFFLVLSVVCFSVSAFPGLDWVKRSFSQSSATEEEAPVPEMSEEAQPEEPSETLPEIEPVTEPIPSSFENQQNGISGSLEKLQASIDALEGRMTTKDTTAAKDDLLAKIEAVSESVAALVEDNARKDEQIDTLLHEVRRVRYFINLGAVAGLKDDATPVFGACANFGVKLGFGLTVGVGAQYFLMEGLSFTPAFDLRKCQVSATVGWEF